MLVSGVCLLLLLLFLEAGVCMFVCLFVCLYCFVFLLNEFSGRYSNEFPHGYNKDGQCCTIFHAA